MDQQWPPPDGAIFLFSLNTRTPHWRWAEEDNEPHGRAKYPANLQSSNWMKGKHVEATGTCCSLHTRRGKCAGNERTRTKTIHFTSSRSYIKVPGSESGQRILKPIEPTGHVEFRRPYVSQLLRERCLSLRLSHPEALGCTQGCLHTVSRCTGSPPPISHRHPYTCPHLTEYPQAGPG